MAYGLTLTCRDEMENWLRPGRLAVRVHPQGHRLLETTKLCKMLYLILLEAGFTESGIAERVHDIAKDRGIGEENAFAKVVLGLAHSHKVVIPQDTLRSYRQGYAQRGQPPT